ncbi:MAG: hypothetical protein ACLSDQ_12580, partial [Adlercreutzia equolifaciens]
VEEAFGKYQLASPLARVLAMIDAEPPSREAKLEVAPVLEGDAGAAEVVRAVKAGETIGVAFVDPEQVSLFDEGATGAFATDEATVVAVGDDALALLAQVVRKAVRGPGCEGGAASGVPGRHHRAGSRAMGRCSLPTASTCPWRATC